MDGNILDALFLAYGFSICEKVLKRSYDNAINSEYLSWRLMYAFIEEKEHSKEEKTRRKNW
jgi:hypothetical protein